MLDAAGLVLSGTGAPTLRLESAVTYESVDPRRIEVEKRLHEERAVNRPSKPLTDKQRAYRDRVSRSLDIDHAVPASRAAADGQPFAWLAAANLQFMFGDDNRYHKGDRYSR